MSDAVLIIWDWNGTLVNDAPLACEVLNDLLLRRGLVAFSFADYQKIYGLPVKGLYERAGFDLSKEPFESLSHEWHDEYSKRLKDVRLQEDSITALQRVKAAGVRQAVLSALPHDILCESINIHGVGHYFAGVCGSSDRLSGSKTENGRALMKGIGVPARDTVLIGDSSQDVETAEALDVECLLVSRGFEDRERLLRHGRAVFADFSGVLDYLKF